MSSRKMFPLILSVHPELSYRGGHIHKTNSIMFQDKKHRLSGDNILVGSIMNSNKKLNPRPLSHKHGESTLVSIIHTFHCISGHMLKLLKYLFKLMFTTDLILDISQKTC